MEFGTNIDEKTQKVNYGYLTFNSGKKILLDVGEVKEFEDQLRLARAGGKEKERNNERVPDSGMLELKMSKS